MSTLTASVWSPSRMTDAASGRPIMAMAAAGCSACASALSFSEDASPSTASLARARWSGSWCLPRGSRDGRGATGPGTDRGRPDALQERPRAPAERRPACRGGGRGCRRRGRGQASDAAAPRRDPDGHQDAEQRRRPGDAAHHGRKPGRQGSHPHDLRYGQLRPPGPQGGGKRIRPEGLAGRVDRLEHPRRRRRRARHVEQHRQHGSRPAGRRVERQGVLRRPHRARARDPEAPGDRNREQADRVPPQDQREDGSQPRQQHVREAEHRRSCAGCPLRGTQGSRRGLILAPGEPMIAPGAPSRVELTTHDVDGTRGRLSLDSLRELWAYREVFVAFTIRHFKIRYKQAAIGVGWSLLQPLLAAGIFAIFLGRFAHLSGEGRPYFLFALAGLVPWTFCATALNSAADSLIRDSSMVRKVYFPREILPLSAVAAALADLPAALLVLLGMGMATGGRPSITWLLIPLPVFMLLLFASSLGLILSALNVYYRDIRHALPFFLQIMMFGSPIVYSLGVVPLEWRGLYQALNPVATAVDDIRRLVLHDAWPDPVANATALLTTVALLLVGYYVFQSLQRDFADHL